MIFAKSMLAGVTESCPCFLAVGKGQREHENTLPADARSLGFDETIRRSMVCALFLPEHIFSHLGQI
jgi:hypothetical protein